MEAASRAAVRGRKRGRQPLGALPLRAGGGGESPPRESNRPGLRRATKRIVLRIRKDFIFNNQPKKSRRRRSAHAVKENLACAANGEDAPPEPEQPAKKRRGRKPGLKSSKKFVAAPAKEKKPEGVRRPGRPRRKPVAASGEAPILFHGEERLLPARDVLGAGGVPWRVLPPRRPVFRFRQFLRREPLPPSRPTVIFFRGGPPRRPAHESSCDRNVLRAGGMLFPGSRRPFPPDRRAAVRPPPVQPPSRPGFHAAGDAIPAGEKPFPYPDTLSRGLIVESIGVLYDLDLP